MGRPKTFTKHVIEDLAEKLLDWIKKEDNWFLKKFAVQHGIYAQRLVEFAEQNKKFAEALKIAKDYQEVKIVEEMTRKGNNPAGWIFLSKNVAGYRDKNETDIGLTEEALMQLSKIAKNAGKDLM